MGWTPEQLPDLQDRTIVITGGNSGLGLRAATLLAARRARVVITARSEEKAARATATIREELPEARLEHVLLDLADLHSVEQAAEELGRRFDRIDALVNNAGVMQTPLRRTAQGFELQLGTNHLGHFRLNALLFETLEASGARIVPVSSIAHKMGRIDLEDLNFERRAYDPTTAYAQSKLANLMYGLELQRRLEARDSSACAIPVHPGYAATNLQSAGVGMQGGSRLYRWLYSITNSLVAQSSEAGAHPLVLATAWPEARGGRYYGPTGLQQLRGPVGESYIHPKARDAQIARGLWERSEELVGPFPL